MITIKEQTENRRPLALRELKCWTWLVRVLGHRGITPNQISLLGMGFGILAGALFMLTGVSEKEFLSHWVVLLAAVTCVILRGACNIFDGVLAVETGKASRIGVLYNEVPDRISDIAILAGAGYAIGSHVTLGWAAALGSLATAYLRVQVQLAGASPDFSGPMAKPARMTVLCLAAGLVIFAPGQGWSLQIGPSLLGPIGLSLAIIVAGTFLTSIVRLYNACQELLPRNHDVLP